jgi:hypothetical protein
MIRTRQFRLQRLLYVAVLVGGCGGSPTAPERHGPITVGISCTPIDGRYTACRATVSCGLYGCYPGTPPDLTATATWTSDDPSIMRITAAGMLEAVAPGDTVVRASHPLAGSGSWPISVFRGTAPLPTFGLFGVVSDGSDPARPPLNGATVVVLNGLRGQQMQVSGVPPSFLPGYWPPSPSFPSGFYMFFGLPRDTYRVRVSKPGYVTQERDIIPGSTPPSFVLQRE